MTYTIDELRTIVTPVAVKYGLKAVYVFGSYAAGTAHADSDVDLVVDTEGANLTSLLKLGALYCDLEEALGKPIDLITERSLNRPGEMESERDFKIRVAEERRPLYAAN